MKSLTRRAPRGPLHPVRPVVARAAVVAAAAVLATSGCGQAPSPSGTSTPAGEASASSATSGGATSSAPAVEQTVTSAGVRLEASMAVGLPQHPAGNGIRRMPGLVVEYTLTNTGARPLVAYDVVPEDLGSATVPQDVNPEHAWVYVESGVLRLSKQGFAPARGVRFAAAPMTGARALDAGSSLTGRAYAVSPPTLDVPGDSFEAPRAAVDAGVKQWQFCVQVGERTGPLRAAPVGGDVLQAPTAAPTGGELVCTEPGTIPVA
jgi:hypothetical protein